jgi:Tol biopolymer transport system component
LELLEGETLRENLGDGATAHALPPRKAIEYAAQLATGLAAAHERGVIHRDLKPENVFVTKDGRVKILDFGLAKLLASSDLVNDDRTQAKGTNPGTVMGTAGYMSPEQVRGQDVDHRTDIFSFGAILYELLSGRRAFRSTSSVETMNAILHGDPPEIASSAQYVPPAVERIIRRCLEKNPEERFQSARDLAFALETLSSSSSSHAQVIATAAPSRRWNLVAAALLLAAIVATAAAWISYRLARSRPNELRTTATQLTFDSGIETSPSISPDGKTFVFVRGIIGSRRIFLQRVDGRSAIALSKSPDDDDHDPAFSPDGDQIAFRSARDGGGIFVMGATGESVRRVTNSGFNPSWSPDGRQLVFCSEETQEPTGRSSISSISIVDVGTGAARKLYGGDAMMPTISPHGKRIAYWALPGNGGGQRDIYTIAMSGDPKTVVRATNDAPLDWNPIWAADGKSIFFSSDRGGSLNIWRLAIDEDSGRPLSEPQPLGAPAVWAGHISVSRDGQRLIYASTATTQELRRGTIDPLTEKLTLDAQPVLSGSMLVRTCEPSPDGKWIAFSTEARQEDVYVMRTDGSELRQLTNDLYRDRGVSWSPDGTRVLFYSTRASGTYDAWSIRVDGSDLTQLTSGVQVNFPFLSPDGHQIAFLDLTHARLANIQHPPATTIETLPRVPDSNELFWPTGWSPDGTMLVGMSWVTTKDTTIYTYSPHDHAYRKVGKIPDVANIAVTAAVKMLDDHRVVVARNHQIDVYDLSTKQRRVVGFAERASLDRNGHYFLSTPRYTESDIWQIALNAPESRRRSGSSSP